jgi:hypothetical protein
MPTSSTLPASTILCASLMLRNSISPIVSPSTTALPSGLPNHVLHTPLDSSRIFSGYQNATLVARSASGEILPVLTTNWR